MVAEDRNKEQAPEPEEQGRKAVGQPTSEHGGERAALPGSSQFPRYFLKTGTVPETSHASP